MAALTEEIEATIGTLAPGPDQARAMTAVALSAELREQTGIAVAWADRALALADELDLPEVRLAALVEKGLALADRAATAEQGRTILAGLVDEAEKRGEWVLAARALNMLVLAPAPGTSVPAQAEDLERMRLDAERAGFEWLAVASYYGGRARLAVRDGNLSAAIAALAEARSRDRGYAHVRRGRRLLPHAVFLAGLSLESGELDRVDELVAELAQEVELPPPTVPGLVFHLACRRGDPRAAALLDPVVEGFAAEPLWRTGDHAHDLVSAAWYAGLPLPRLRRLAEVSLPPDNDQWRTLVEAQLAEAGGDPAGALAGYSNALEPAAGPGLGWSLPPSVRGTAHVGAARCLLALDRPAEATVHADAAAGLLARWSGWRVAQLSEVQARLGLTPPDGEPGVDTLTPREREVALLIADGLTNTELARRLYISPRTAAVHVSSILRKLGVSSRTEVRSALAGLAGHTGHTGRS
jgi:DNA-binding CsgD family transcriptional regulator